eukprot:GHVH01004717.1.p1 GENE.GHVH01004717.1~~GHVH01004717.1.p1  ORF type:complete len:1837 (+),score=251.38 GHVH01004717.1:26-5512(+)
MVALEDNGTPLTSQNKCLVSVRVPPAVPRSYDIDIGAGIITSSVFAKFAGDRSQTSVIVTESNVFPSLLKLLSGATCSPISDDRQDGISSTILSLPINDVEVSLKVLITASGEDCKSFANLERMLLRMLDMRVGVKWTLVAIGGGAITDFVGFVSTLVDRGINNIINVPTTLLAAVDASVGGKTAVNLGGYKNKIGQFRQPSQVTVDLSFFKTLPIRQWRSGLAEVVKMAVILDADLFNQLMMDAEILRHPPETASDIAAVARMIQRSVQLKADVVAQDEKDVGVRRILNFGHTIGHALEAVPCRDWLHGESVAVGMMIELAIIKQNLHCVAIDSIIDQLTACLDLLVVPSSLPKLFEAADDEYPHLSNSDLDKMWIAMKMDKKREADRCDISSMPLIVVQAIGRVADPFQLNLPMTQELKMNFSSLCRDAVPIRFTRPSPESLPSLAFQIDEWRQYLPGSKSMANRLIVLATLFTSPSSPITLHNMPTEASDVSACLSAVKNLGCSVEHLSSTSVAICGLRDFILNPASRSWRPLKDSNGVTLIDVVNSGTTIRFILPLLFLLLQKDSMIDSASEHVIIVDGNSRMRTRPLSEGLCMLQRVFPSVLWSNNDHSDDSLPLTFRSNVDKSHEPKEQWNNPDLGNYAAKLIEDNLIGGDNRLIVVEADSSTQFLSGVLMIAPYLGRPVAAVYHSLGHGGFDFVHMTLRVMDAFGFLYSFGVTDCGDGDGVECQRFVLPPAPCCDPSQIETWTPPSSMVNEIDAPSLSYAHALADIMGHDINSVDWTKLEPGVDRCQSDYSYFKQPMGFKMYLDNVHSEINMSCCTDLFMTLWPRLILAWKEKLFELHGSIEKTYSFKITGISTQNSKECHRLTISALNMNAIADSLADFGLRSSCTSSGRPWTVEERHDESAGNFLQITFAPFCYLPIKLGLISSAESLYCGSEVTWKTENDHRLIMSGMLVGCLVQEVTVDTSRGVEKTFPMWLKFVESSGCCELYLPPLNSAQRHRETTTVVMGMRNTGKTYLTSRIRELISKTYQSYNGTVLDLDHVMAEDVLGYPIEKYIDDRGIDEFRVFEKKVITLSLTYPKRYSMIVLGGGALETIETRELLVNLSEAGLVNVIWLTLPPTWSMNLFLCNEEIKGSLTSGKAGSQIDIKGLHYTRYNQLYEVYSKCMSNRTILSLPGDVYYYDESSSQALKNFLRGVCIAEQGSPILTEPRRLSSSWMLCLTKEQLKTLIHLCIMSRKGCKMKYGGVQGVIAGWVGGQGLDKSRVDCVEIRLDLLESCQWLLYDFPDNRYRLEFFESMMECASDFQAVYNELARLGLRVLVTWRTQDQSPSPTEDQRNRYSRAFNRIVGWFGGSMDILDLEVGMLSKSLVLLRPPPCDILLSYHGWAPDTSIPNLGHIFNAGLPPSWMERVSTLKVCQMVTSQEELAEFNSWRDLEFSNWTVPGVDLLLIAMGDLSWETRVQCSHLTPVIAHSSLKTAPGQISASEMLRLQSSLDGILHWTAYVVGDPIINSQSPALHSKFLSICSRNSFRDASGVQHCIGYERQSMRSGDESKACQLVRRPGTLGISVTIPLKESLLAYCKGVRNYQPIPLIEHETVKKTGCLNTLMYREGCYYAYNTDFIALQKVLGSINLNGSNILIVGAGGTARAAVCCASMLEGTRIFLTNRSRTRLLALLEDYPNVSEWRPEDEDCGTVGLVVDTTPFLSMGGGESFEDVMRARLNLPAQPQIKFQSHTDVIQFAYRGLTTQCDFFERGLQRYGVDSVTYTSGRKLLQLQGLEQALLFYNISCKSHSTINDTQVYHPIPKIDIDDSMAKSMIETEWT